MSLASGVRLGAYEIVSPLGAGGMGEVYRARDTKLGRDVAIKILPELFTRDPDRVARFQREAQLLAALNHPHIGAIYGLEEAEGAQFLVLELIDGETLQARLVASGALDVTEALAIAQQIADALDAAHDKGIIHRDLKPANIALTVDGHVKVLDFGLARFAAADSSTPELTHSPTITFAGTQAGMILGTAAYMSPEQAKGRVADKRSDVWAFGCVLFEMLTGKKAFEGEDVSDTLAAILRGEPDWYALPKATPAPVRTIVRRCLEKDRKRRLADLSVVLFLLDEGSPERLALQGTGVARGFQPSVLVAAASGLVAAAAIGVAVWVAMRGRPAEPAIVARYAIVPPASQPYLPQGVDRDIAISADGTHIVYRAGPQAHLMIRAIDQLEATPLRNTDNPRQPFISPDGKWVGFFAETEIKKVPISGGPAVTICAFTGPPRGASWGADGTIIFATGDIRSGLMQVAAAGGSPRPLTTPDPQRGERDHYWPAIVAGRGAVLFTISAAGTPGVGDSGQVALLDLKTGATKILIRGGSDARYAPGGGSGGYIVYGVEGTLRAVRFDAARLETIGDPVPVLEQVMMTPSAAANFSLSNTGTLVYVPGSASSGILRSLVWVDRQGRAQPIKAPMRSYTTPRVSPDGRRVALEVRDQDIDIWILELARETLTRLTFGPAADFFPVWTPDGRRVVFASQRDGSFNLYWQAADGSDTAERLTKSAELQYPWSMTPDGSRLVLTTVRGATQPDLDVMAMTGDRRIEPLLRTPAVEINGELSPDGHWLAYQSTESGAFQIYVRPFPNAASGGLRQISTAGGTRPVWSRNGRELFFVTVSGALFAVPLQTSGPTLTAGAAVKLFDGRYYFGTPYRTYDVSPDGQQFLMINDAVSGDDKSPSSMVVVEHWFEDLKQKLPVK